MRVAVIILASIAWFSSYAQTGTSGRIVRAQTYTYVEQMPEFRGNLEHYIAENRRRIKAHTGRIVKGKVVVNFTVNKDDNVKLARVLKTGNSLLDMDR